MYGSRALRLALPDSDLDIAVTVPPESQPAGTTHFENLTKSAKLVDVADDPRQCVEVREQSLLALLTWPSSHYESMSCIISLDFLAIKRLEWGHARGWKRQGERGFSTIQPHDVMQSQVYTFQ